ncbi:MULTISPECIES: MFS transporter [Bradyrhizobium]|jgi:predicted MFS family arabinose efflux permease|uniref:MFS family arabinose efflux permease n=1 Tax=Bradyrhizobium elkanii TaxID=29448 RepID=A0ABV4FC23_BRAEL|nr:MFS transporter [Bradyrhizobium elkanii]MBP2431874.1 putative MFS family arabinose efflux permease [Bradyrhizobium elkanii]MCP1752597.1 putative MFS family arabinose efflux permease [Bradyrhizobium elkanii]MCP1978370.1 putative MFS family arabinose efflux permease [Bradyrhizobium elkanii]MCS3686545.1 putative MFS family arabinose efflux permease [Bradyrhizobium elkanii]MCS3887112.1 putative MFS family arabinose efflux permease [Bradyrhizobium elkanii]
MSTSTIATDQQAPELTRARTLAMAICAGIAVANIYYNQPLLGLIEASYPNSSAIGLIPTATQFGYAVGLLFLVPLGDLVERRRLIAAQFVILAAALAFAAVAPSALALIAASLMLGVAATVAQQIVPFAATLADDRTRGAAVGTVVSGILGGILLSRTIAGFVGSHFGWREMFWLGAPLALGAAALVRLILPRHHVPQGIGYPAALRTLVHLLVEEPTLRLAAATQAMLFASFIAFWTVLSLHLREPAFGLGPEIAGLFGVIGASGMLAAPLAGRVADKRGPHLVIAIAAAVSLSSWAIFGGWNAVTGLIVGVVLLDAGVNAALVSNQHLIFALRPEARSRLNTVFMTAMFVGGSLGSLGASWAYTHLSWLGVCGYGAALATAGLLLQLPTVLSRAGKTSHH